MRTRTSRLLSLPFGLLLPALVPATLAAQVTDFKFGLETLGGRKIDQDQFKDCVLLVDVWGTWCGPCRQAVPVLVDLYARYKHHGLEIVGINYEHGASPKENRETVRTFAREHKITYPLAIGTPDVQNQIEGFSGYPTLLFFKKGLKFDHMEVGFEPAGRKKIETWIRKQLGLSGDADGAAAEDDKEPEKADGDGDGDGDDAEPKEKKPVKIAGTLPKGTIHQPGDGDTGFDFELSDPDGQPVKFADYQGKVVAVPLMLAGAGSSLRMAQGLKQLSDKYGKNGFAVVGACFGQSGNAEKKKDEVRRFAKDIGGDFKMGVADLSFIKKVHNAGGFPILLLFDRKGVLKARITGVSDANQDGVEKKVREVLGLDL